MMLNPKKWIAAGLVLASSSALASVTSTSFQTIEVNGNTYANGEPGSNFNTFSIDAGNGITIDVSGWSDTAGSSVPNGMSNNNYNRDAYIERAVDLDRNGNGWSMVNVDEANGACGYHHSADNSINQCGTNGYGDYDFFLLDFNGVDVQLDQAAFSWRLGNTSDNQVTFIALDSSYGNDLTGDTFADLQSGASGYGYSQMFNGGNISSYYADVNVNSSSSLWVVSAYNSMFGGNSNMEGNDGFKLAGVQFTVTPPTTTTIPEPTPFAIMAVALGLLVRTRKQQ
ncbi:exosortase-dependent surface protein XDP1 [Thalassotalea euphylliae]|uniref:exosortase-dependent surface protein XDP1 n=1 Tax=Thalassotalea euphylliae TaxID=1655234 RepID=UPI0036371BA8